MTHSLPKLPAVLRTTPSARPDQARLKLLGVDLLADTAGAIYVPAYSCLLVADLHFEKGSARAGRGVHLPPYDTRSTLLVLETLIERYGPRRLICLGDSFHDTMAPARINNDDFRRIRSMCARTNVVWLTGNHDPALPDEIGGSVASTAALGPLTLRHEPTGNTTGEIAGHLHPVASVISRGRKLTRKCFVGNHERVIMPALGAFTGGLNVNAAPFIPLFPDGQFDVWMATRDALHRFSGRTLQK